jgi:DNA-binding NarL/FixJ family response regulator
MNPLLVVSLLVFSANIVLWVWFFLRYKRQSSPGQVLASIRDEVDKILLEISREADRDITLIDDKMRDLQAIINEAERYIRLSDVELRKREREQAVLETMRSVPISPAALPTARAIQTYRQVQGTEPEREGIPVILKSPEPVKPKKSPKEQALELFARGFSSDIIAQKLGISITEVEIFIASAGPGEGV